MIVKFPNRSYKKRLAARRPRRSKNGTPEERAAKAPPASPPTPGVHNKQRRSKNGTPEQRAARKRSATVIKIEPYWTRRTKPAAQMVRPLSTEEFAAVVAQMDQGQLAELMERMEEIEARTRDDDPPDAA